MKNLFDIKDKVVVITGGTGVLGKAIAFHLAEEGARGRDGGTRHISAGCIQQGIYAAIGFQDVSHVPDNRRDEP